MDASIVTFTNTPVNFTRADLNAVANIALAKVGQDKVMARAIERALVLLGTGQWSFDGVYLKIRSNTSTEHYTINTREPMTCSCKGRARGYRCKHIVAGRLILRAAEYHAAHRVIITNE